MAKYLFISMLFFAPAAFAVESGDGVDFALENPAAEQLAGEGNLALATEAEGAPAETSAPAPKADIVVSSEGLVDSLKENHLINTDGKEQKAEDGGQKGESWVGKAVETVKCKIGMKDCKEPGTIAGAGVRGIPGGASGGDTLDSMMALSKKKGKNGRSNAAVFDISGAMLRMPLAQVEKTLASRGYKKISQKLEIPNFIKWRNEERCRIQGVIGFERLAACVAQMARKDKHEFVETAEFAKFDTQEEIIVKFTSNFAENKAYRVFYKSMAVIRVTGNTQKETYLRNIKVYDFWKKINQKYGAPDDKQAAVWGMGDNKPYMQAATGRLVLEDPMLRELDYTRMSREDQRYLNTNLYNF